jgi:hypothetical protein
MSRKKISNEVPAATAALLRIAAQLETGELGAAAAAEEIRTLIGADPFPKFAIARGRPKGSHGAASVSQAREYFELIDSGMPPARAAEKVAAEWQVNEGTISKNARRHEKTLVDETHRDIAALHLRFAEAMGKQHPTELGDIPISISRALEETAQRVEAAGNSAGAAMIRHLMPKLRREMMAGLGKVLAEHLGRKTTGNEPDS